METLEKLFGGASKVKVMRLFIFNPEHIFDIKAVALRSRISLAQARKEVALLAKIKLIKKKVYRGKQKHWYLDESFIYIKPIKELMSHTIAAGHDEIVKKLGKVCKLKSVILSGIFINHPESRADLLIIANSINKEALHAVMKKFEAEIGRELRYAVLNSDDFTYRLSVGDRLVRDVLDYPHRVAYDKIGIE